MSTSVSWTSSKPTCSVAATPSRATCTSRVPVGRVPGRHRLERPRPEHHQRALLAGELELGDQLVAVGAAPHHRTAVPGERSRVAGEAQPQRSRHRRTEAERIDRVARAAPGRAARSAISSSSARWATCASKCSPGAVHQQHLVDALGRHGLRVALGLVVDHRHLQAPARRVLDRQRGARSAPATRHGALRAGSRRLPVRRSSRHPIPDDLDDPRRHLGRRARRSSRPPRRGRASAARGAASRRPPRAHRSPPRARRACSRRAASREPA